MPAQINKKSLNCQTLHSDFNTFSTVQCSFVQFTNLFLWRTQNFFLKSILHWASQKFIWSPTPSYYILIWLFHHSIRLPSVSLVLTINLYINLTRDCTNVWLIKIRTTHNLSLWLYEYFWIILLCGHLVHFI